MRQKLQDLVPAMGRQVGRRREAVGTVILWFGLLAPLAISEGRAASEIAADPITPLTIFRGVTPVVCLLVATMVLRPRLWPENRGEWLAGLFAAVAVASTLWSIAPVATLLKAGVLAAVYGLVILLVRTWQSLAQALGAVVTVAQGLIFSSLLGAWLAPESVFTAYYGWGGPLRLRGLFPEIHFVPLGWLALVALLGAVAGIGCWTWQRRVVARSVFGVAAVGALVLTQTRAAWGGTVIVGLVYLAMRGWHRALAGIALVLVVGAVGLITLAPDASERVILVLTRGEGEEGVTTLGGRLPKWERAVDVWSTRPVTGDGYYAGHRYGPYAEAFAQLKTRFDTERAFIDGAYIETLLDLGVVGLLPLAGLAVSTVGQVIRHVGTRDRSRVQVVAALTLGALLIDSVLSYSWQTPSYQGILLLALALFLHSVSEPNEKPFATGLPREDRKR